MGSLLKPFDPFFWEKKLILREIFIQKYEISVPEHFSFKTETTDQGKYRNNQE